MFKQIIYFSIRIVFTGKNILVTGSIIKICIWKDDYWEKNMEQKPLCMCLIHIF